MIINKIRSSGTTMHPLLGVEEILKKGVKKILAFGLSS